MRKRLTAVFDTPCYSNGWNDTRIAYGIPQQYTAQQLNDKETHYLIYDGAQAHRGAADPTDDIHVKMLPFLQPVPEYL